jgi:hypothetical protein
LGVQLSITLAPQPEDPARAEREQQWERLMNDLSQRRAQARDQMNRLV